MPSVKQPTRRSLRRKMVLPVTVIRRGGQEKYLSHTLDLTDDSARLGGLRYMLEPGEIIELQRGANKAKFQVVWMGEAGSAMEGQAGVRCIEPGKVIWNIALPANEIDIAPHTGAVRAELPPVHTEERPAGEKRWAPRHECSGGASVRAEGSAFPVHGEVKENPSNLRAWCEPPTPWSAWGFSFIRSHRKPGAKSTMSCNAFSVRHPRQHLLPLLRRLRPTRPGTNPGRKLRS